MSSPAGPADILRIIEQLCEHFERASRQGRRPPIPSYLAAVPPSDQPAFFRELLLLEIDYRNRRGEAPAAAEYRSQWPQFAQVLDEVFGPAALPSTPSGGDSTINFRQSSGPSAVRQPGPVRLEVLTGPRQGLLLEIPTDDSLLIGRDETNHISLAGDEEASRFHCLLEVKLPACFVRDLKSRKGTWIGERRVEGIVALRDGEVLTCGASQLRVSIAAPVPSPGRATRVGPRSRSVPAATGEAGEQPLEHPARFFPGYELEKQLGKGGMGLVYRARELASGRSVALKVISPEWAFDEDASRRFLREVSALARLRHRRIVELLEAGWIEGHLFLAMEYIEQVDVAKELAGRELRSRVRMACGLTCQVLEGLRFAHGESWVHRDLKPANVLVSRASGRLRAKIADFGLAKNYALAGQSGVTQTGQPLGTLPFMAPEQFTSARDATPLMDVYSAGATLYFWLSGKAPLHFDSTKDAARTVLHEAPRPIQEHLPELPSAIAEIIHRALAKDATQRWSSADAMWKALAPMVRAKGTPA